jgi:hypothetical protein
MDRINGMMDQNMQDNGLKTELKGSVNIHGWTEG